MALVSLPASSASGSSADPNHDKNIVDRVIEFQVHPDCPPPTAPGITECWCVSMCYCVDVKDKTDAMLKRAFDNKASAQMLNMFLSWMVSNCPPFMSSRVLCPPPPGRIPRRYEILLRVLHQPQPDSHGRTAGSLCGSQTARREGRV